MRRALFTREFRTALLPNLVTVGAILGTLIVLERIYSLRLGKEDIHEFIDLAILAGLVVSGFISGERCFPGELKESRMFFLSSLPISRSWVWLSIVSGRLLAALLSFSLVVALRRPVLAFPESGLAWMKIGLISTLVLCGYLLFFSAGALFALLFRRTLFSYAAGLPILGALLIEALFSCSYPKTQPAVLFANPTGIPDLTPHPLIIVFLSFLLIFSLLGSWRFFVWGEIGNPKVRMRKQLLFSTTIAAYLCILVCITASPRLASAGSNWSAKSSLLDPTDRGIPYSVSPDGRYLAVSESSNDRPFLFRLNIVDTQTGRILSRSFFEGVNWVYWSSSGDILNLVALNNSPLDRWGYLAPATVDWVRLSPDAREVSRQRLRGIRDLAILTEGRSLAVRNAGDQGRIDLLDGASGRSSEIAHAPLDGYVEITADGPATLVYFRNTVLPSRVWVVDSIAHEIRLSPPVLGPRWVLFGERPRSFSEAETSILRRFGAPLEPGGAPVHGRLLLPFWSQLWILNAGPEVNGVYFLEESASGLLTLWARSTAPEGRWEKLPDLTSHLAYSVSASDRFPSFIDFPSGVAVFPTKEGGGSFFVYDPRIGTTREAGSCSRELKDLINLSRVAGLKGLLITLNCVDSSFQGQTHYFEYLPGSREVRAIKTIPARPDFFSHPRLYFDERGLEVWMTPDNEIWRSAPGRKDLLLWRGQREPSS